MPVTTPIAVLPNGVVATNSALTAVDIATVGQNALVTTLGGFSVGDGMGGTFYFDAASSRTIESGNVLATSNTGRWIKIDAFSGVGPTTTSLTGYRETFALLSGFAPIVYTLPQISNVALGTIVTVKTCTTGTASIRCGNATDLIVDNSAASPVAPVQVVTSTLTGGQTFNFLAGQSSRWFRIDKVGGAI